MTVRYFDGCPNWRTTQRWIGEVLSDLGVDLDVALEQVGTPEDAERLHFIGSPTLLVDGRDPFEDRAAGGYGLSCRVYRTPGARRVAHERAVARGSSRSLR